MRIFPICSPLLTKACYLLTLAPGRPGSPVRPASPVDPLGPAGPGAPRSPGGPWKKERHQEKLLRAGKS